jgi:hypothetical protein
MVEAASNLGAAAVAEAVLGDVLDEPDLTAVVIVGFGPRLDTAAVTKSVADADGEDAGDVAASYARVRETEGRPTISVTICPDSAELVRSREDGMDGDNDGTGAGWLLIPGMEACWPPTTSMDSRTADASL